MFDYTRVQEPIKNVWVGASVKHPCKKSSSVCTIDNKVIRRDWKLRGRNYKMYIISYSQRS